MGKKNVHLVPSHWKGKTHLTVFELLTIYFLKVAEIILSSTLAASHWSEDLVSGNAECNVICLQFLRYVIVQIYLTAFR